MRVATWNVNCFNPGRAADKLRLLELESWDVALLQEVNEATFATFTGRADIAGKWAVELVGGAWSSRAHGVAILARPPAHIVDWMLLPIDGASAEERALAMAATIVVDGREVTVASAHMPNAAGTGGERRRRIERKMRHYRCLSEWCSGVECPLVVGADTNTWSDSAVPLAHGEDHPFAEEHRFVGLEPDHRLVDVYREHLVRNRPDLLERRRQLGAEGPDGALAATHVRGGNHPRVNRMDRIYASRHFRAVDVATLYEDALTVGSDHALIIATLELTDDG